VVGDGEQTRDYIHVSDVVKANILATTHKENLFGEIFNVGTGKNYSINWIASKIEPDPTNIINIAPRPGEARDTIADTTKIEKILGWKATISLNKYI
jgi:UDP-glucose 4-epimerase